MEDCMSRIHFSLNGGLSPSQIHVIHDAVLRILADTGMACEHKPTADAVSAEEGISYSDGRLKFAPEVVEAAIETLRAAGRKRKPEERIRVTGPWTCFNVIDMQTNDVRASTSADAIEMMKLVASFNDEGPPPVYPNDVDDRLQVLWLEKACLETTPGLGGAMVTHEPDVIRWIGELHAAASRRYVLALQFVISPLTLDHVALDLFWKFKDDPLLDVGASICPIPTGGMTAPLTAPGLLAQSLAESLAGWIVANRLGLTQLDQLLPIRVDFGDMRDLTVAYSLPENAMIQVLLQDLGEHFAGYRLDWIYLDTNAKRADTLAAVDRTAYLLMLGLAGFRHFFMGAGQLSMDETFSPAQFIIDMEIGRYVQHVLDGMKWGGSAEEIAKAVAEGVAEGNFLTHPTTLESLPDFFDSPLFRRDNVGRWRSAGEPSVEQLSLAKAQEAIDSYHYEIDAATQQELDRIFQKACESLGVKAPSTPARRG
jgi:trimethylamine:corrinoid methyltransferase-like protein